MPYSAMLRLVALVRTNFLEESSASILRVKRIGELGTTLEISSNRRMLRKKIIILEILCLGSKVVAGA
jgi:hypothetical protein